MKFSFKYLITVVALATAMSVVITSCSKDDKESVADDSYLIIGEKWLTSNYIAEGTYSIEFKIDHTYKSENPKLGNADGNFRIYETLRNQEITMDDNVLNTTLFKMLASGSTVYDQIWVYHFDKYCIVVEFYSNNELLTDRLYVYWKEGH